MSMSTCSSVDSEHHAMYEEQVRQALPSILWSAFKLPIGVPDAGVNRTFKMSTFAGKRPWPFYGKGSPTTVEVDFWAHSPDLPVSVPYETFLASSNATVTLFGRDSSIPVPAASASSSVAARVSAAAIPSVSASPSPERESYPDDNLEIKNKYVLGEITMGGRSSVQQKLVQLEKDVCIAMAKSGYDRSPLDAVSLAIVVNHRDHGSFVSANLSNKHFATSVPHLATLFRHGRVAFVQYTRTPLQALVEGQAMLAEGQATLEATLAETQAALAGGQATLEATLAETQAALAEGQATLVGRVDALATDMGDLKGMMYEILRRLPPEKGAK